MKVYHEEILAKVTLVDASLAGASHIACFAGNKIRT